MSTLKQIRYFLTIADTGGFTQAAAVLFIAQPALSRQIAQLEEQLGFKLFEREPRGVRLTPAGSVYRERIQNIHSLMLAASEEGKQLAQGEAGTLRLLHSSSIPVTSLAQSIDLFLERCPKATIDLDRVASESQISAVANGHADLGIVRLPVLREDSRVQLLALPSEKMWVALPEHHPLANHRSLKIAKLRDEPFVSAVHRERGGLARRVTDLCLSRGFTPKTARVTSRKTSMLNLVASGQGIAVIPERMVLLATPGVIHVPLKDDDADASSALVLPLNPTPLARSFADICIGTSKIMSKQKSRIQRDKLR